MANATVSLQGAVNNGGAADALFYKIFTGEVLTAYEKATVMNGRVRTRKVSNQKSASFANTGRSTAEIHAPGTEITGQAQNHNETVIPVDELLISHTFIADIYEAMNHYEVRGEYANQMGQALARGRDKTLMRNVIKAARASNKVTGLPGGTSLTMSAGYAAASDADKATELADFIFQANKAIRKNDASANEAICLLDWDDYFRLVQNKDLLNRDWGGMGSYANADLPRVGGLPIVPTNMFPRQDDSANTTGSAIDDNGDLIHVNHSVNSAKVQALVFTPECVGEVSLIDLSLQSEYDIRRQGTLMVARKAYGAGVLRPETAVEIVIP